MNDKFSVAFEFYINVGHAVVEKAGVSREFADLVWKQAEARVRGETSLDASESRKSAMAPGADTEKHKKRILRCGVFGCNLDLPTVFIYRR